MLAPQPGDSNTFRLIHRFADAGSLHAWEDSDARRRLSAEADQFSTSQYLVNVITNVLLVGLLTYVAMPLAARALRRWLY